GSVVTSTTVSVRLDAECTVDPSTLAVSLNGASIPASQFQPFSACQNGRMSSQTVSVGLTLPHGTITSGPTSLVARTTASFSGSGTGDGFSWNFDGGAQPATGASVSATFNAAATFTVRLRATKTEQLQASAMDDGNVVTGQLAFAAGKVLATLAVGDEPTDVAFASGRAFVTLAGNQDRVNVYDAATRAQLASIALFGDDPRALAVNPAGTEVYAIVLESGNKTTTLFHDLVNAGGGPPPPNPPRDPALGTAPEVGLI